jgi:enoyl-[acyl-carrier protein] reductase I
MKLLEGKKGIIFGVLNSRSIAYGIAKTLTEQGAEFVMTYLGDAGKKRIEPIAKELGVDTLIPCDATNNEDIDNVFKVLDKKFGKLDFLVHSIAYSDKDELRGRFYDTTMENFKNTMLISCYSLIALTKRAVPLMNKAGGGSIIAMTYYGAEKVIPHYNVMGVAKSALESSIRYLAADLGPQNIRVNGISSGPMKTLAAAESEASTICLNLAN